MLIVVFLDRMADLLRFCFFWNRTVIARVSSCHATFYLFSLILISILRSTTLSKHLTLYKHIEHGVTLVHDCIWTKLAFRRLLNHFTRFSIRPFLYTFYVPFFKSSFSSLYLAKFVLVTRTDTVFLAFGC